ncbi:DUF4275 family protein [Teredinibacter sp. KSP-S5-2]|uniref:DUF4275 family protein n=1 Tax=Teredinibacter sp. KSP-S5-2 TaxID=3034506 RepID=UPI0029348924|nr:DUF4275 family protein [Teredinibacter sp. KSP-S5-2]WNO11291.1 DUF4275 family protein [Teredinibacter sp. KSP-S5-2]
MEFTDIKPGQVIKIYSHLESKEIERSWMAIFCKNKTGLNTKDYKWHIFSGGGYPSLEADEAQEAYESHVSAKYVVMPNNGEPALLTDERPSNLNYYDVYVFPENMAWTMAFTHEEGWLGPYFAKHPSYTQLEKENEKYKEKLKQIEIARNRGWM